MLKLGNYDILGANFIKAKGQGLECWSFAFKCIEMPKRAFKIYKMDPRGQPINCFCFKTNLCTHPKVQNNAIIEKIFGHNGRMLTLNYSQAVKSC